MKDIDNLSGYMMLGRQHPTSWGTALLRQLAVALARVGSRQRL